MTTAGTSDVVTVAVSVESRVTASVVPTLVGSTNSSPPGGGVGVESRVAASVVPKLLGSTASVPPGGGVAVLRGSPFEGLTVAVKPVVDSVTAFVKSPHKAIHK